MMEKEIIDLVHEQNILENHIEKTELWIEYLGVWQASIIEAMVLIYIFKKFISPHPFFFHVNGCI